MIISHVLAENVFAMVVAENFAVSVIRTMPLIDDLDHFDTALV
jgi:hypothetical protein